MNTSTNNNNDTYTTGWHSTPGLRGTADILSSCLFTIGICCWTTVYPNVPAINQGKWDSFRDKFNLACIGLLGPEFLLGIALGQRTSARRSVKKFKEGKYQDWTLTHAFFADMGGFFLKTEDLSLPIPLDAEQIFYLVKNNYVDYPLLSEDDIADRNKAPGLARMLTIFQALWFLASTITRPIQGLSMTTLELTTISFVIVTFAICYCWLPKPCDISRPVILHCDTLMADIRRKAQLHDPEDYITTPLDFVYRDHYLMGLIWEYYIELLQTMRIPLFSRPIRTRPHDRIRGDKFLRTELDLEVFAGITILLFGSTFICAWNFHFPTTLERAIWRCASIYFIVFVVVGGGYTWIWHLKLLDRYQDATNTTPEDPRTHEGFKPHLENMKKSLLSKREVKDSGVPLIVLLPISIICAFYCLFRAYILVEDIIGLRSLPSSAYIVVNWSKYIPHV